MCLFLKKLRVRVKHAPRRPCKPSHALTNFRTPSHPLANFRTPSQTLAYPRTPSQTFACPRKPLQALARTHTPSASYETPWGSTNYKQNFKRPYQHKKNCVFYPNPALKDISLGSLNS